MADDDKLLPATVENLDPKNTQEVEAPETIEVGQWYWVKGDKGRWFGCIVHVGSNYVEVESPRRGTTRIHFDEFWDLCKFEPQPDAVIEKKIAQYQREVGQLLGRVKEVTAQLAITPSPMLNGAGETQALALRGQNNPDMKEYGAALVKAKEKTLPDLFKEIERANESMAEWMTAKVVPLKAQAEGLKTVIGKINDRIFSVELYAGLVEEVERVRDGDPAALTEKIHLLQRRCYMDEECLARYETGGMEFKDIHAFDAWISRDDNFERLLPFPRCVVAFQVRRNRKMRELVNLIDIFEVVKKETADKFTFLYIRNGGQLFRLSTGIEFDEKLFPDLDRGQLQGKLWAKMFCDRVDNLITDNERTGIIEERRRAKKEWETKYKAYQAALKTPEAKAKAKAKGKKQPDASCVDVPWVGDWFHHDEDMRGYEPYDKTSVYYDDITKHIEKEIQKHNRIALILQGLLDRSPVLHPHPPWQIWTEAGFRTALELVYDDSRALVAGEKPDFDEYRRMLNASLKPGSITVGQEDAWELYEGKKESERRDRDYRRRNENYRPSRVRPHGNPGPGTLARLVAFSKGSGKCTFAWNRKKQTEPGYGDPIRTTFACNAKRLLNVDAYTPGDFRTFFDDPRTRAEYLKWAPLLLEAEEYHAGNRKVQEPPPPEPKKESSWEGQKRYEQRKRRKATLGKAVRLTRVVETKGGTKYEIGSLWRVTAGEGGTFSISGIKEDGTYARDDRYVRGVHYYDFQVDPSIPADPKAKPEESEAPEPDEDEDEDEDDE